MWIIKSLVELPASTRSLSDLILPYEETTLSNFIPFEDFTEEPQRGNAWTLRKSSGQSLEQLTANAPTLANTRLDVRSEAVGQIWRSLGNMILTAADRSRTETDPIMPHVLEIIAFLHHSGVVPESVYNYTPAQDSSALQQPPTLHLLSSRVLTSLTDAAWRAHQTTAASKAKNTGTSYDYVGRDFPGARYKVAIDELGPEVWLELVLWSCLHGPWLLDGAAILTRMSKYEGDSKWSLVCWQDVLRSSEDHESQKGKVDWNLLQPLIGVDARTQEHQQNRLRVERTISSEVVAAFVDGLMNQVRVGVGARGEEPRAILEHVNGLKMLLDRANLGLGGTSWDAVVVRFLESEGINAEKDPDLLLDILRLVQPFGAELNFANAPVNNVESQDRPTYVLDGSAAALGLLHRAIRAYARMENTAGALQAFEQLQSLTDSNKRRSLEEFFRSMRDQTQQSADGSGMFDSKVSGIDYPSFYPQVPSTILAALLDLSTRSKAYDFGNWLLYSEDIDGPIIPPSLYGDRLLAPAIIRFGTATRDKALLARIIEVQSLRSRKGSSRLPDEILVAFINSQIENRRWDSVDNILKYLGDRNHGWGTQTVAVLARELLRHEVPTQSQVGNEESFSQAKRIFRALLQGLYGHNDRGIYLELNGLLGVLSSVSLSWAQYCTSLFSRSGVQPLRLPTPCFNTLLEGVVDAYGSIHGKRVWDIWCEDLADGLPRNPRHPGGISRLPRYRPSKDIASMNSLPDIKLDDLPDLDIAFRGRVTPTLATIRIIIRKAIQEQQEQLQETHLHTLREDRRELVHWAELVLRKMGIQDEDTARELGVLRQQKSDDTIFYPLFEDTAVQMDATID
ncbi:hypothetical protein W97_04127 [Coniosporium apollinis CBS 100218]|uniref:Uncharacterized protein n=1 Tax=Coniosporium apollinis (strain CBS 100218) TaxID=1168221 RepID=R7YSS4_CONA1|nr:uncharacterized protein W97_04127 [Coniosporium apollinis CBS 100218]EON64893.1 hypothetical protein W97_04127 [Coniosporium apollinis CBS 100218]